MKLVVKACRSPTGRASGNSRSANETPIVFEVKEGGWVIRAGFSRFLVAEGSVWSMSVGRALFETLRHNGGRHVGKTVNSAWTREDREQMQRVLDRQR